MQLRRNCFIKNSLLKTFSSMVTNLKRVSERDHLIPDYCDYNCMLF